MIFVARVAFNRRDDFIGAHEARDIIHMAIRVIPFDSFFEPDNLFDSQIPF